MKKHQTSKLPSTVRYSRTGHKWTENLLRNIRIGRSFAIWAAAFLCSLCVYAGVYCPAKPGPRCIINKNCPLGCLKQCFTDYTMGFGLCNTAKGNSEEECTDGYWIANVDRYNSNCVGGNCGTFVFDFSYGRTGEASQDTSPCTWP
jgi:hypothetical protein